MFISIPAHPILFTKTIITLYCIGLLINTPNITSKENTYSEYISIRKVICVSIVSLTVYNVYIKRLLWRENRTKLMYTRITEEPLSLAGH